MMNGGMDGMGGMMLAWMILWGAVAVALIGFAVVGIVTMVRRGGSDRDRMPAAESSDEVLRRRYAAGDIDQEEFETRRAGLKG